MKRKTKVEKLDKGSLLYQNRRESLGDALIVVVLKRECPVQVKVNIILAIKLEKETKNKVETSKVNFLVLVEDEDDRQDMILVQNPNRFR